MAQINVRLKLVNGKIEVKPSGPDVKDGDTIQFYAEPGDPEVFEVLLHNSEDFFAGIPRVHSFTVDESNPTTLDIQQPNNNIHTKYYSVCVIVSGGNPQPLPPDAPPRIIRST
jgi:hypothetical protein